MSQKLEILEMLKLGNCTTEMISNRFGKHAMRKLRALREDGHQIKVKRLSPTNNAYMLVERPVVVPVIVVDHPKRMGRIVAQVVPKPVRRAPRPPTPFKPTVLRTKIPDENISDLEWWAEKRWELSRMLWRI